MLRASKLRGPGASDQESSRGFRCHASFLQPKPRQGTKLELDSICFHCSYEAWEIVSIAEFPEHCHTAWYGVTGRGRRISLCRSYGACALNNFRHHLVVFTVLGKMLYCKLKEKNCGCHRQWSVARHFLGAQSWCGILWLMVGQPVPGDCQRS